MTESDDPDRAPAVVVVTPEPPPPDEPRLVFQRGTKFPRAIAWFGASAFWGHLWHLAASVIATEDIDSRAWMHADDPEELTRRIARELGGDEHAASITEALEDDLWIDFVADTGDDVSVSVAVAELVFAEYDLSRAVGAGALEPGEPARLPRGQVLLFGGDTAYPVATELEIHNRVIVPFNQVLRRRDDGKSRVLVGVPGNHDWYGGLDGFGRMFRRVRGEVARASRVLEEPHPEGRPIGRVVPANKIDRAANVGHFVAWIEAFRVGRFVAKRTVLRLLGYTPVQSASYFALRLAPGLDLFGPDRQLREVDVAQRAYFAAATESAPRDADRRGVVLCIADPASAFLEPSAAGRSILKALDVELEHDGPLVLSGDTHHYCREDIGAGTHVTAGGGGAFLHPARISRRGVNPPRAEFPGPRATLSLALRIPFELTIGRSGFLAHAAVLLLILPTYGASFFTAHRGLSPVAGLITSAVAALVCFLIAGARNPRKGSVLALAIVTGLVAGFLPGLVDLGFGYLRHGLGLQLSLRYTQLAGFALCGFGGTFVFGSFLTALTVLGIEQHQAFAALAHPGYKHFVRLRVRRDGSAIDGWALGKVDPLSPTDPVVLVDRFTWKRPAPQKPADPGVVRD